MEQERGMDALVRDDFKDKELVCVDCGSTFTFTAGEQFFFAGKGLTQPRRCPACRRWRKSTIKNSGVRHD